jgi:hypothetical protein
MLRWPVLQFPNRQLEASYQASRSRFLLQVDTWHGLLVLAYISTWLAVGAFGSVSTFANVRMPMRAANRRQELIRVCV